jgi:hypothetical protein
MGENGKEVGNFLCPSCLPVAKVTDFLENEMVQLQCPWPAHLTKKRVIYPDNEQKDIGRI